MVWIVRGAFHHREQDSAENPLPVLSHYLRPERVYKTGRAGGLRSPGADAASTASRDRPYDFKIKSLSISKDGAWEFDTTASEQDRVRNVDPTSLADLDPYPLRVHVHRKNVSLRRRSTNEASVLVPQLREGERVQTVSVTAEDGDEFQDAKGYWFRFEWKPIVLCLAPAIDDKQRDLARSIGIKITNSTPPTSQHTHYVVKSLAPTHNVSIASLLALYIVSPSYVQALFDASTVPSKPAGVEIPIPPREPSPEATRDERKVFDQDLIQWEKRVVSLNRDIGSMPQTYFGHSPLELDFDRFYPLEEARDAGRGATEARYLPKASARYGDAYRPEVWAKRDERRKTLLRGIGVVDFREDGPTSESDALLVSHAGGTYFSCDSLSLSPLPPAADIVETIRLGLKERGLGEQEWNDKKVVLFVDLERLDPERGEKERLKEVQQALGLRRLSAELRDLLQAIYDVDASGLLEPDPSDGSEDSLGQTQDRTTRDEVGRIEDPEQPSPATPPFPTGGVPGTHPESNYAAAVAGPSRRLESVASRSGTGMENGKDAGRGDEVEETTRNEEAEASVKAVPRKLTRRARTAQPSNAVENLLFGDDETMSTSESTESSAGASGRRGGHNHASGSVTHQEGRRRGEEFGEDQADLTQASLAGPSSAQPQSSAPKLRRRVQTGSAPAPASTFFDLSVASSSPETFKSSSGRRVREGSESRHQEMVRDSVPREERLRRIMEEDDREIARGQTQASTSVKDKGKGRDKRGRSVVDDEGSVGEEARDVPPAKRASKKEGEESAASLQKRGRDQARAERGSSEREDEEGPGSPPPRKRPKQVVTSDKTAPPKTKKDAAAAKKAEKEAEEKKRAKLLQIKTSKRKGAQAEVDHAFNEDFNALKIVKPVIKAMPRPEKKLMTWNEEDSDVERDRLIREDQEHGESDDEMDPNKWRASTQAMFNVRDLEIEKKERAPRRDDIELPEKWAGRSNFKRFRPKNSKAARVPLAARRQVELAVPDAVDFGLGEGYVEKKKPGRSFAQIRHDESEDADEDLLDGLALPGKKSGQAKLDFSKTATKAKSAKKPTATKGRQAKGKQVVVDSEEDELDEEEEDQLSSSNTLRGDDMDVDENGDFGLGSRASSTAAARRKPPDASAKKVTRKAATETIMIDDSDSDSDSGLTFKGFGKQRKR
ncbi:hypothetical protein JCM10212_000289 [Sporobolomyces blumeae]